MFEELINAVQNGVKPEIITVNGREFATRPVFEAEPLIAACLTTATLQSLADYLTANIDGIGEASAFLHVEGPDRVSLNLDIDKTGRRATRIAAKYEGGIFAFGKEYDQTQFITLLRSQFVPSDERESLQKFVGSLTDESSLRLQDNGVSQQTVAKKGIATIERVENKDALTLAPYRTFAEIDQPESEFILRLHRRDGDVPRISLHESDNQAWKIEAINRIAEWLKKADIKIPVLA